MSTPRRPAPRQGKGTPRKRVLGPMPAAWVPNPGLVDPAFVQPEYPADMPPEGVSPWTPAGIQRPGARLTPVLAPSRGTGIPGWAIFAGAVGFAVIVGFIIRGRHGGQR